ncbi:18134_t:CDS:1, partial [Gigaspora rosea]
TKGNLGSKQIYPLIVESFQNQLIHKRDIYNAVYSFRAPLIKRQGDAQNMINKLLDLQDQETGWIIKTRLDPFDNRLTGLFWMSPSQQ